jgi:lipopolysaccharide export system permease protein
MTLLVLASLAAFFSFLGQLSDLSDTFGVWQAAEYVILTLPRRAYELFPTSVLLGSLLGLGALASNSELIVMRAAGLSVSRIAWSVIKSGVLLMLVAILLGEVIGPPGEQYAQTMRAAAQSKSISLQGDYGFWARDGSRFVHIRKVLPGTRLEDISIYEYNDNHELLSVTKADSARYEHNKWLLTDIKQSKISVEGVSTSSLENTFWESLLKPEVLDVLPVAPENLSARSLHQYVEHLQINNLDSRRYELAFWVKLVTPLSALVMLIVAMPFVFGPLRSTGTGLRILIGVLVGMGFFLLNQGLNQVGLVYGFNPLLSAITPSVLFAIVGMIALKRVF